MASLPTLIGNANESAYWVVHPLDDLPEQKRAYGTKQSSTATGLMASSFTASGVIDLVPGRAVMLGANVSTTLIVQVLSFDIGVVAPILILAGVVLFRRGDDGRAKNLGRIAIGLGLMLLALNLLVRTMTPIGMAPEVRTIVHGLANQPVLALVHEPAQNKVRHRADLVA
jgi:Na+/phosphate symporter